MSLIVLVLESETTIYKTVLIVAIFWEVFMSLHFIFLVYLLYGRNPLDKTTDIFLCFQKWNICTEFYHQNSLKHHWLSFSLIYQISISCWDFSRCKHLHILFTFHNASNKLIKILQMKTHPDVCQPYHKTMC